MIGDVTKAKKALANLIGASVLKGLLRWMKDDLSCSKRLVNVDSFVNTVNTECKLKDQVKAWSTQEIEHFWKNLKYVIKRLSTRPHTSRNGNFYKYVRNDSGLKMIGAYMAGGSKYPSLEYKSLKRYLTLSKKPKNDPNAEGYKRHENLNDKMGSLLEVNRLKILATALTMALLAAVEYKRTSVELENVDNMYALLSEAEDVRARLKAGKL